MNINKKSAMKLLSAILCTCLLGSGIGAIAYAQALPVQTARRTLQND